MRRGERKPEDLTRPQGNDLKTNYEKHDVGEAEIVERLEGLGYEVTDWGIDMRHDDGEDGLIYDDKMDLKVSYGGVPVALVDVKTKSGPDYMGRFNERHYVHYHEHAEEHDVPVFVVMFQVDYREDEIHDGFVFHIDGSGDPYDRVHSSADSKAVDAFPDGNTAVLVPHEYRRPWTYMEKRLAEQVADIQLKDK